MIDPGTQYVIDMLGRTLAERDHQIELLAREVRMLRDQLPKDEPSPSED